MTKKKKPATKKPVGARTAAAKETRSQKATKKSASQPSASTPRVGSKTAQVLALLEQPSGASLQAIMQATGWQAHYADVRIMPTCVGNPACGAGITAMESA